MAQVEASHVPLANALVLHSYAGVQAALLAIWLSVAVGAVLGASQRLAPIATDPIRTFALVAAALVVGLSLLPHALLSLGGWGLLAASAGLVAIPNFERVLGLLFRGESRRAARLELSYAGLVLHRVGDGVAMSVEGHGQDLLFALGAHEVPIVALVVLIYAREGLRKALVRAAWLGLASTFGLLLVRALPRVGWHTWHGWIDAVSAGILLHIVAQELGAERLHGGGRRALDVLGAGLAFLLVCLPTGEGESGHAFELQLLERALDAASPLLLGFVLTALGLAGSGGSPWQRARIEARTAHRLAAGELRPDTIALSVALLGWPLALARGAGTLCIGAAAALGARLSSGPTPAHSDGAARPAARQTLRWQQFWEALDRLSRATVAPLFLGLVAASYVEAFMPPILPLDARGVSLSALSVAAIALPARLCAGAATPVAAALLSRGLHPGLALAGFWLGAASNTSLLAALRGAFDAARLRTILVISAAASVALVLVVTALPGLPASNGGAAAPDWLRWPSLICLALLLGRQVWQVGVRNWLGASLCVPGQRAQTPSGHAH